MQFVPRLFITYFLYDNNNSLVYLWLKNNKKNNNYNNNYHQMCDSANKCLSMVTNVNKCGTYYGMQTWYEGGGGRVEFNAPPDTI